MNPKHSPGPWRWDDGKDSATGARDALGLWNAHGGLVLVAQEAIGQSRIDPNDIDLIAKAPEMAAMLRELEWADCESEMWAIRVCPLCKALEVLGQVGFVL